MEFSQSFLIYSASILLIASVLLLWGLYLLRIAERKRLRKVKKMDVTEAIETEASDEDIESITRKRAITNISSRFSTFRRLYIPLVILISGFFILIPMLTSMSATYVSLFAGAIAVIAGLAAKPLIENAFAGFVITIFQPLRIGDTVVIDGKYGTVESINSLYTVVKVWNWRRYVIPNHRLLQKDFENLSKEDEQEWAHVEFSVAPGSDIEQVKKLAKKAMNNKYLLKLEPPSFWVVEMKENAIHCWVAGWASTPADAWALKSTTRRDIVKSFSQAGIPFHMINNKIHSPSDNTPAIVQS